MPASLVQLRTLLLLIILGAGSSGCGDGGALRGKLEPSSDGKTYLAIADDSNGNCRPIYVDGKHWPHALNVAVQVSPGQHTIGCGADITFEIPEGVVFRFNYWGP